MLVDISQEAKIGIAHRPGSPALEVKEITCNKGMKDEYKTIQFTCATHNLGTHIDVVGVGVEIPLDRLIGTGIKYDISHIIDRPVEIEDIELSLIKGGEYIFFHTGFEKHSRDMVKCHNHPELSIKLVEKLIELDVNMIGTDATGVGRGANHGVIDVMLAKVKKYAIENLCNLDKIPDTGFKVYNLPSKTEGLDVLQTRIIVEF